MTTKRQLAAIMFTDISGYSAMMQADEDYARRIRHRHRSVFKAAHERHGGNILQYYGDGTLSIFDSAAAAVECAVDMQIEYRREPEVPLRIGIHTGDISWDEDGAYGDGLNIASRIEKLSIPGSVYISAKVFDDIKNHKWLTATSLGRFELRNINNPLEVYAVTCKGIQYPTLDELLDYPELVQNRRERPAREEVAASAPAPVGNKKKGVAVLLAFFFGWSGIHRIYMGQRKLGMFWLIAFILSVVITANAEPEPPPVVLFGIFWLVDFILLAAMSRADFNQKYNEGTPATTRRSRRAKRREARSAQQAQTRTASRPTSRWRERQTPPPPVKRRTAPRNPALIKGVRLYKNGDYEHAIDAFEEALDIEPGSPAALFNLACCYSMMNEARAAYDYLSLAIENGFTDFQKLETHQALAYLRDRSDYQTFVDNGYKVVDQLPEPKSDLIEQLQNFNPSILDKIEVLGERLESGELTRDEFEAEKRRILGHEE